MKRYIFCYMIMLGPFVNYLKAQGLNNSYKLDEVDVKNAFNSVGIEFFKFPIACKDSNTYLNYYLEEYNDTSLIYSSNIISELEKKVPKDFRPAFLDGLKMIRDTDYFRIIVCAKDESGYNLNFYKTGYSTKSSSHYDPQKYGTIQSRAFKYVCPEKGVKTPVLVIYANNVNNNVIHCPQSASPDRIRKTYNYSLFVFLEFTDTK